MGKSARHDQNTGLDVTSEPVSHWVSNEMADSLIPETEEDTGLPLGPPALPALAFPTVPQGHCLFCQRIHWNLCLSLCN